MKKGRAERGTNMYLKEGKYFLEAPEGNWVYASPKNQSCAYCGAEEKEALVYWEEDEQRYLCANCRDRRADAPDAPEGD